MKKRKYTINIEKRRRTQGCMTDCVAYYFNLHPENVPLFVYPREGWNKRLKKFFLKRGLQVFWQLGKDVPKKGMYLVSGDSKEWKTYSHMVVYKNGKLVYDPNYPSQWTGKRITHWLDVLPVAIHFIRKN